MVEVRPATEAELEAICEFLATHMDPSIPRERFRRLFTYPWMKAKPDLGFVLVDDGRLVGYISTIYADRVIRGRRERFCNLSSWCVLPGCRNHSLRLLSAAHRDQDQTFTNLTARPVVRRVMAALRYQVLDTYKLFTVPLAQAASLLHFPRPRLSVDPAEIARSLNPSDLALLRDHEKTACGHLLLEVGGRYCYVVWNRRVKHSVPFSEILYVSDAGLLRRHFERVKLRILWRDRTLLLAIDGRLLGRRPWLVLPYKRVTMFQSRRLQREDIDNLYSELVLL